MCVCEMNDYTRMKEEDVFRGLCWKYDEMAGEVVVRFLAKDEKAEVTSSISPDTKPHTARHYPKGTK